MDWKDLAGTLIKTGAPIIGGALGGPLGATVGGFAGKLLADALGVEATPEAVHEAIQADPAGAAVALGNADAQWQAMAEIAKAEAADRTAQGQAINETIRAEVVAGVSWYHWRHILGYVVVAWFVAPLPAFFMLTFKFSPEAATALTALLGAAVPVTVSMSALLGYVAQDTTKLKTTAITGEHAPSITDSIVKQVKAITTKVPTKPTVIGKPIGSRD